MNVSRESPTTAVDKKEKTWHAIAAKLIPIVWYVIAATLIAWAWFYLALRFVTDKHNALMIDFVYFVLFLVAFVVMFYGEGTEVAVAMLIDKDPEQVPETIRDGFKALQEANQTLFISGRQLIVVFAIVGMTFLCLKLSDVPVDPSQNLAPFAWLLLAQPTRDAFTIFFPTFFALWFIQLPPKFIAHESPLTAYSWQLTRIAIACSMFLGKTLRVEGPSTRVKALLMRLQAANPESLRPSRENYYETSATLRDGKAIESADIDVIVGRDGSVRVVETFRFRAFAKGFKSIPQWSGWEGQIERDTARLVVSEFNGPCNCVVSAPKFEAIEEDGKQIYSVEWHIDLQFDLPVRSALTFVSSFKTAAGAAKVPPDKFDFFEYHITKVPTADIVFKIQPDAGVPISFFDGLVTVDTSEDNAINLAEASKIASVGSHGPRGYRFQVRYPLLSTKLRFTWTVRAASPAPEPVEPVIALVSAPNVSYEGSPTDSTSS